MIVDKATATVADTCTTSVVCIWKADKEKTVEEPASAEERASVAVGISSGVQEGATDSRHVDVPATVADAVQTVGKSVVKILDAADGVGGLGPW